MNSGMVREMAFVNLKHNRQLTTAMKSINQSISIYYNSQTNMKSQNKQAAMLHSIVQ